MPKLTANPRPSLTNQAYAMIHTAICDGTFPPGMPLSENHLARQLNMSRTPVREALHVLESQDFVEIRDGLGTFVKALTLREIRDLFQIRISLEVMACTTALDHIPDTQIDALEKEFLSLLEREKNGVHITMEEFVEIDDKLHHLIVDYCQNNYVKKFMHSIMANVKRCQLLSASFIDDVEESTTQHLQILHCIRQRDKEKMEEVLKDHIAWSLKCCVAFHEL